MKIFRFFPDDADASVGSSAPYVITIPDTALLLRRNPFFIPDFTSLCQAQLCLAVRVTRLGRSISPRFASRYYDASAVSLAVHFVAQDLLRRLRAASAPWDMAVGFDYAVAVADRTLPLASLEQAGAVLQLAGVRSESAPLPPFSAYIDDSLSRISGYCTLRQGDLLLFPLPLAPCSVSIGQRLSVEAGGGEILAFNIK